MKIAKMRLQELLRQLPLEIEVKNGTTILSNEDEKLGIIFEEFNKVSISYFTLDSDIAKRTLEGCPDSISAWREKVKKLKYKKGYAQVPYFNSTFDVAAAEDICFYVGSKMAQENLNKNRVN